MRKIFVNGSFDIIHPAHLAMLKYAKSLGDYLLVAIDTDERIKLNKGPERPVNSLYNRKMLMESIRWVDEVSIFNTDEDLISIIKNYQPAIMVKGSDWRGTQVIGQEYVPNIVWYERVENYSTTLIIDQYLNRLEERKLHE